MPEADIPIIRIAGVSKRYEEHDVEALRNISLDIDQGRFVAVMGPSGCGKSSLLNLLCGIDRPSSGKVFVGGVDLTTLGEAQLTELRRKRIGFVFQFFNLLSTLTVRENVELPLELGGKLKAREIRVRSDNLLEQVGLSKRVNFFPAQLSGGELQRAAIVRALIHSPDVVLADEPTGNLDTENGLAILQLLQSLSKEHKQTILMATHSNEAAAYASQIVHMKDGQILQVANT